MDGRLSAVARTVYLAFTLGHTAAAGAELVDDDLQDRAQYLAQVLLRLRPLSRDFAALLALILLTRARHGGRFDDAGGQVLLADADRSRWDRGLAATGIRLADAALAGRSPDESPSGPGSGLVYQAAIAAEHARAGSWAETDWSAVVRLYGDLLRIEPSHTLAVGRSVAVGQLAGAAAGLADLEGVLALGALNRYPYAAGARAFLLEQLGR